MKKILIVDDSKLVNTIHESILKKAGFIVTCAENGVDGLEKSKLDKFDLIVTDLNMPKMGGFELTKQLRSDFDYKMTPIIMVSTEKETTDIEQGKSMGITDYIVKPVVANDLVDKVKKYL